MLEKFISQVTYYLAAITAFIFTNLNDIALFVGIVCTIATTVINWYFKCREDKRRDTKE